MASRSSLSWQMKYTTALHEPDKNQLSRCIEAAESAVRMRLETMAATCIGTEAEHCALNDALIQLASLKRERLGFYPPPSSLEDRCIDERYVA